jgi:hypothetical protein
MDKPQGNSPENLRSAGRLVSLPDDRSYFIGATPLTIGRGPESALPRDATATGKVWLARPRRGIEVECPGDLAA